MEIKGYGHPAIAPRVPREPLLDPKAEPASTPAAAKPAAARSSALREVLTDEERAYFAQLESMGPVTYGLGKGRTASLPNAPLGQRIDARA
jgi:hypothetical protein